MKILAVTACPTGIAHTYMAAECLERAGAALGHQIKVETQGAMGVENPFTAKDLAEAQAVILAADIPVQGRERFEGIAKRLEVSVTLAIKNPAEIFSRLQ